MLNVLVNEIEVREQEVPTVTF